MCYCVILKGLSHLVCVCACVCACEYVFVCVCACVFVCACRHACICARVIQMACLCVPVNDSTFCFVLAVVFILLLAEGKKRMCSCNGSWLFAAVISCYISITD